MFARTKPVIAHRETYTFGDRKIEVACSCPLGRDHTHELWMEAFTSATS
jgi:hypothetical protein